LTVVSAIISKYCIAVSSDSLISILKDDGLKDYIESEKPKIISIRNLRAAISYWGFASYGSWSTYDWLCSKSQEACQYETLETFAINLRDSLEKELEKINVKREIDKGIGIHLTGYEVFGDCKIPELFLCSNFSDPSYSSVRKLELSRESYGTIFGEQRSNVHGIEEYRLKVYEEIQKGTNILVYNNGDPLIFNHVFNSLRSLFEESQKRKIFKNPEDIEIYRESAKLPIEIISKFQNKFWKPNTKIVGGRTHDLIIRPSGEFSSHSGIRY